MHAFHMRVSVKTDFAFFFVLRYNAFVSYACLHRLKRLLRFPWCGVTMLAIHMRVSVKTDFAFFLILRLQCIRFIRVSASAKTALAFSLVWRYNACVSHARRRLLRFPWCNTCIVT